MSSFVEYWFLISATYDIETYQYCMPRFVMCQYSVHMRVLMGGPQSHLTLKNFHQSHLTLKFLQSHLIQSCQFGFS